MNEYYTLPVNKRSEKMEIAALCLAIVSAVCCTCIYASIVCGALAIIFAFLSKGGATSMSSRAVASFVIALSAMLLSVVVFATSFITLYKQYGSVKGIVNAYSEYTGYDYDDLMKQINPANDDE